VNSDAVCTINAVLVGIYLRVLEITSAVINFGAQVFLVAVLLSSAGQF
jgi:hypothetical protein